MYLHPQSDIFCYLFKALLILSLSFRICLLLTTNSGYWLERWSRPANFPYPAPDY